MKEIRKKAWAGTMESSDAYVEVEPAETLAVELQSVVQAQFGPAIEAAVADVAAQCGVTKERMCKAHSPRASGAVYGKIHYRELRNSCFFES